MHDTLTHRPTGLQVGGNKGSEQMNNAPHFMKTGNESTRTWKAPGGTDVVATRGDNYEWKVEQGPENLVGRTFKHMRDLRIAVKQS
jgi:hypothetical protein